MNAIEVRNLNFSYDPRVKTIDGVSFSVPEGSYTTVIGHNGSGKSTIAKLLLGLLEKESGEIIIDGLELTLENLREIRGRIGIVFQNPDNQIVATVVEEDVAFACENMGMPSADIRKRVDESLAAVGMSEFARHAPHLLSGGQKQRVAIAGVLAMRPRCIVMDEPTAMLDPSGREEVMAAVRRLNRETGMTVVLITHHMDEAAQADRVIVMKGGKVALDGTPKQVFCQVERMEELALTAPQTVLLLRELDPTLDLQALSVEECADQILKYLGA